MRLLLLLVPTVFANSAGKTGSSTTGCGDCHGRSASASTTVTFDADTLVVAPGERLALELVVANSSVSYGAGLNVSATGGTLGAGSNTRVSGGEVTHSATTRMTSGSVTFAFTWTAPTAEGTYTLRGAGNAVNGDRSDGGDAWARASNLTLTVDDGCDDTDRDGYEACDDGGGDDCDDGDASIHPGAAETCDGVDEDCDGTADDAPVDGTATWPDRDGDGYGDDDAAIVRTCAATAPAGYVLAAGDCDDTTPLVSPDMVEVCNAGLDDDCDGAADGPDAIDASDYHRDADGDGFGGADTTRACAPPAGYVDDAADCDDTRASVHPDAAEVCDARATDEDCDGAADDADPDVTGTSTWYADADADGFGGAVTTAACLAPAGHTALPGDCVDDDPAYNPAAVESCADPADYNCDGASGTDDTDGDGVSACDDCNDGDAAVFPGGVERCNAVDDDCDGIVDEADAVDARVWYADTDGDGWGGPGSTTVACALPAGHDDDALDCDDTDATVRPDAPETWYDGVDQDCDGADDDQDGDGHLSATDCDDTRADVFPGAPDAWYDGLDADCARNSDLDADADGRDSATHGGDDCDDADPAVYPGAPDTPYDGVVTDCVAADEYDQDGDGYEIADDCDDARSDVHPDAAEVWYDGLDQDCDLNDDDQDGDGVPVADDCDDEDAGVTTCDTGDTAAPDDTGAPGDDPGAVPKDEGDACGCAAATGGPGWAFGLLAMAAGVARRRRG